MDDGGGPTGTAMQVEVSNHPEVLWTKAMVLSVREKAVENGQVWTVEMNEAVNHLRKCRKHRNPIKTGGGQSLTRDKHDGNLFTGYAVGGAKVA